LIGTTHDPYDGDPEDYRIKEKDIQDFISEVNRAYPAASLRRGDVSFFHGGLLPVDGSGHEDFSVAKKYQIRDLEEEHGIQGLISVLGVKYTTARDIAEKAVDLVFKKLEKAPPRCLTTETPVYGGNIERFKDFVSQELRKEAYGLNARVLNPLLHNYGSQYTEVLKYIGESPGLREVMDSSSTVIKAEVVHGVREEMAMKLADVVFRRTELGSAGNPGEAALKNCAEIMARELDWDQARIARELDEVRGMYSVEH
jgi:glycerol-3-phosphate dehydrogenase